MPPARNAEPRRRARTLAAACAAVACGWTAHARAQVRGVYPLGMSATGSGLLAEPGFTYVNMFLFYSRDRLTDSDGDVVATGLNSVLMDMNTIAWVSEKRILGGARFSAAATLPIANNSLSSDETGAISGGGGFADSFYQPAILGWRLDRASIKVAYGFLAPTGSFDAEASDNVGSGYWTHVVSSGQTFFLGPSRATIVSAFEMYEVHGSQSGTGLRPGDNLDLDWSVMRALEPRDGWQVQWGAVGYSQWQTSAKRGPGVTPDDAAARYRIHALGFASTVTFPERKLSLGAKYFDEISTESSFEGGSVQIFFSVGF